MISNHHSELLITMVIGYFISRKFIPLITVVIDENENSAEHINQKEGLQLHIFFLWLFF
jgi:hypothetical protein